MLDPAGQTGAEMIMRVVFAEGGLGILLNIKPSTSEKLYSQTLMLYYVPVHRCDLGRGPRI